MKKINWTMLKSKRLFRNSWVKRSFDSKGITYNKQLIYRDHDKKKN